MISIRLLGSFDVRDAGAPVTELAKGGKKAALLVALAWQGRGEPLSRDAALGLLWGDQPEDRARASLRSTLWALRNTLGKQAVQNVGRGALALDPEADVDLWAFRDALGAGQPEAALALYGGALAEGLNLTDASAYAHQLDGWRERLRREAVAAVRAALTRAQELRQDHEIIRWARRGTELAPFDERLHRDLMRYLAEQGDRAGALRVFQNLRTRLAQALETDPDPTTVALARELAAQDAGAVPQAPERAPGASVQPEAHVAPDDLPAGAEPASTVRSVRRPLVAVLLVAALAIVLLIRQGTPSDQPLSPPIDEEPTAAPGVIVFPFDVRGTGDLAYLRGGMPELLSSRLDLPGVLRPIDPRAVLAQVGEATPRDPQEGVGVARTLDASHFVLGSVVQAGDRLAVNAALYDARGAYQGAASVELHPDDLLDGIDDLAQELAAVAYGPSEFLGRTAARTAPNLTALQSYLAGESAYRQGLFADALTHFGRAIAEDSTYALAHFGRARAALWEAEDTLVRAGLAAALRHADQLPPRAELLVRAHQQIRDSELTEARRTLGRLVARYPDYVEALYELADLSFHDGPSRGTPAEQSAPLFRRVLSLDPGNRPALIHLTRLASLTGDRRAVDTLSRKLTDGIDQREPEALALRAISSHDSAEAAAATALILTLDDATAITVVWRVASFAPEPGLALPYVEALADPGRGTLARAFAQTLEAWIHAAEGRLGDAWAAAGRAASIHPIVGWNTSATLAVHDELTPGGATRAALLDQGRGLTGARRDPTEPWTQMIAETMVATQLGILATRVDDETSYELALGRLRDLETTLSDPDEVGGARQARVFLEMLGPDGTGAPEWLDGLQELRVDSNHTWYVWPSGVLYVGDLLAAADSLDSAHGWYRSTAQDQSPRLHMRALGHLRAGRTLARAGRRDEALAEYGRFLHLWRGHDALGAPLVQRAEEEAEALG